MGTKRGFDVVATLEWVETTEYRSESHMETAVFQSHEPIEEVVSWAQKRVTGYGLPTQFTGHLTLTVAQIP